MMGVGAKALPRLREAWSRKVHGMKQMNGSSEVQPGDPRFVFRIGSNDQASSDSSARVDCGPVVLNLCERASGRPSRRIYVVVRGWIGLETNADGDAPLCTRDFGTEVGYFRLRDRQLVHVYGVHYDMDLCAYGHPVFHAQVASMAKLATEVKQRFCPGAAVCDRVKPLLRTVRTPTAQMDFLSVLTQVCADHLMSETQGSEKRNRAASAFGRVRSASDVLLGAAHRFSSLNDGTAPRCYRSSHWYWECEPPEPKGP